MKLQNLLLIVILAGAFLFSGCSSDKSTTSDPIGQDDAPPLAPCGLCAPKVDDQGFKVTWEPNTESDFVGYRVYLFDPSPYRDNAYVLANEVALLTDNHYTYFGEMQDGVWVRVSSVDQAGNESSKSEPLGISGPGDTTEHATQDPTPDRDGRGGPIADPEPDGGGHGPEPYQPEGGQTE